MKNFLSFPRPFLDLWQPEINHTVNLHDTGKRQTLYIMAQLQVIITDLLECKLTCTCKQDYYSPEPRHKQFKKKTNWQNTKQLETLQVAVIAILVMYKVSFRLPSVRSEAFSICRTWLKMLTCSRQLPSSSSVGLILNKGVLHCQQNSYRTEKK